MSTSNNHIPFDQFVHDFLNGLYGYAKLIAKDQILVDDAVQEALIHVWKEYDRHPGKPKFTYFKAGKNRILRYITQQDDTGRITTHKRRDPLRDSHGYETFTDYNARVKGGDWEIENQLTYGEQSIHKDDVVEAVEALPAKQREYVEAKFWEMLPSQELKYERRLTNSWKGAKKNLEKRLHDYWN